MFARVYINQMVARHVRTHGADEPAIVLLRGQVRRYARLVRFVAGPAWLLVEQCPGPRFRIETNAAATADGVPVSGDGVLIVRVDGKQVQSNARKKTISPVLYLSGRHTGMAQQVHVFADGSELAWIRYSPDKSISSGARVWVESNYEPITEGEGMPKCPTSHWKKGNKT